VAVRWNRNPRQMAVVSTSPVSSQPGSFCNRWPMRSGLSGLCTATACVNPMRSDFRGLMIEILDILHTHPFEGLMERTPSH